MEYLSEGFVTSSLAPILVHGGQGYLIRNDIERSVVARMLGS